MPSDLQALLAAVVDDPADDVARLVYADCLEENGNAARAAFIRLQIEAERHHPNSNARAALEAQARALFERHWVEWWSEVCVVAGFPLPASKPVAPYSVYGFHIFQPREGAPTERSATFRGGFPDSAIAGTHLHQWFRVSPLRGVALASNSDDSFDGPHMATVQYLELRGYNLTVLDRALSSPHLGRLESLGLRWGADPSSEHEYLTTQFAADWARTLAAPRVRHLKMLAVHLDNDRAAEALARAETLAGLESLEVSILDNAGQPDDRQIEGRALLTLARSPHLAGLKELTVPGGTDVTGFAATVQNPTWAGLRKLTIDVRYCPVDALADADDLLELEELRLTSFDPSNRPLAALRHSPLLKRLRHFSVRSARRWAVDFDIAYAVDADRIETFAIGCNDATPRILAMLRERFGNKLCVLSP